MGWVGEAGRQEPALEERREKPEGQRRRDLGVRSGLDRVRPVMGGVGDCRRHESTVDVDAHRAARVAPGRVRRSVAVDHTRLLPKPKSEIDDADAHGDYQRRPDDHDQTLGATQHRSRGYKVVR